MLEVEAKVAVADAAAFAARCTSLLGPPDGPTVEEDTFFADEHGRIRKEEAVRLRRRSQQFELTYKGPRLDAEPKTRVEHNVPVMDDPTSFLAALGLRPAAGLRKTRRTWRSEVTVTLDELEGLGAFVEVEVLTDEPGSAAELIATWMGRLGLDASDATTTPYLELALAAGAPCAWTV